MASLELCKALFKGMATYVPGLYKYLSRRATGGTVSARYCYSVWLRHLVMLHKSGFSSVPRAVAEIGPGDSLGIGLAAMLTGAESYFAFDVVLYANTKKNLEIFDELVGLFEKREKIPDAEEFPNVDPSLDSYEFPSHILTNQLLETSLRPQRLVSIRKAIVSSVPEGEINIKYIVPWADSDVIRDGTIDLVYSQAVLEHVNDLCSTYQALHRWLKPGGAMSHVIDFKCHDIASQWNEHWTYSDGIWKLIVGKRPYLLNRHPHSTHIEVMENCGFKIVCDIKNKGESKIERADLAKRFRDMTDDDLITRSAFIQASK